MAYEHGRTLKQRLIALAGLGAIVGLVVGGLLLLGVLGANNDVRAVELLDTPSTGGDVNVGPEVGKLAPNFEISDFSDKRHRLSGYRGQVVYINFWATWCVPCQKEMPDIAQLQKEYGEDIVVISVNRREPLERARDFLENVPNLDGGKGVSFTVNGLDPDDTLYEHYRGLGMPTSIFVSADGIITRRANGIMTLDEMREAVDGALAGS
jgi:thiol-disulfide isomerase/thioredoxin